MPNSGWLQKQKLWNSTAICRNELICTQELASIVTSFCRDMIFKLYKVKNHQYANLVVLATTFSSENQTVVLTNIKTCMTSDEEVFLLTNDGQVKELISNGERTLFQAPQNDHTTPSVDTLKRFNNDRRRAGFVIDINFANPHKLPRYFPANFPLFPVVKVPYSPVNCHVNLPHCRGS